MKKLFCSLVIVTIALFAICTSVLAESTSEILSSYNVGEVVENNDPDNYNPPYGKEDFPAEYIDPLRGSISLTENLLHIPGKNGLDVDINLTYNNQELEYGYTWKESAYEAEFNPIAHYYSYYENGVEKTILIQFESEDVLVEQAPLTFSAKSLPSKSEDDRGTDFYLFSRFNTSESNITFERIDSYNPEELTFFTNTHVELTDIFTKRITVGDLWQLELPTVVCNMIAPELYSVGSTYDTYKLNTVFLDLDNEYRHVEFTYKTYNNSDNVQRTSINISGEPGSYTGWYGNPYEETVDEERDITYICYITDSQGRTMYFDKKGMITAIEDRFGNVIKYYYSSAFLRVTKIEDTLGRIIDFDYDGKDAFIYIDNDGDGPEEEILYAKILHTNETDEIIDEYDDLISDNSLTSKIIKCDIDGSEYVKTFKYVRRHASYYQSSQISLGEQQEVNIVTEIIYPNEMVTQYNYEPVISNPIASNDQYHKKDYHITKRTDKDSNDIYNETTYNYVDDTETIVLKTLTDETITYEGESYLTTKTTETNGKTLVENYVYTKDNETKKRWITSVKQTYKDGSTVGTTRTVHSPIDDYYRPSGVSYDDYDMEITYSSLSMFPSKEIYNQSDDVLIKKTYSYSSTSYPNKTLTRTTVSQSTNGGNSYAEKYFVEYTYNLDGTLASETVDSDGINRITTYSYTYGTDGSMTTTTTIQNLKNSDGDSIANITSVSKVNYLGQLIYSRDGNGNETTYDYDGIGRLVKVTNPDDTTVTYVYDTTNRTTIVTDENGIMQKVKYDGFGNVLSVYRNVSTTTSPHWTAVSEYEYDALCRPVVYAQYTGYTSRNVPTKWLETHYTYGAFDNVSEVAVYDETGNELSKETYTYNYADRIGSSTSTIEAHDVANGGVSRKFTSVTVESTPKDGITPPTVKQYLDRQGRLCKQITTDGDDEYIATYTYDALGNVLEYKDEAAYADYDVDYSQKYEYNYNNQVIKAYNADENYITNTYDVLGRQLSATDYMGNTTTYTYDSIGRVLTKSAPVDTDVTSLSSYYYDANGNTVQTVVSAAAGDVAYTYSYDNRNRLVSSFNGSTYTVNQYDGNQLVKTASGLETLATDISELTPLNSTYNVTDFAYDNFGNLISETTFNGTTSYTYDLAGNTLTTTDPKGQVMYNTYDSRSNLLESVVAGDVIEYEYNSFNYITLASRNNVATTYAYDNFGRNISEVTGDNSILRTYNTAGQVETMLLKKGTTTLQTNTYEYNILGNMTSASDGVDTVVYEYNENGFPTTEEKSGLITEYEYTPGNLMKSTTHNRRRVNDPTNEEGYNDIRQVSSFVYSYYPDGNIKTVSDTRGSTTYDTIYGYDAANRLTIANTTSNGARVRTWGYNYNNRGDRTSQTVTDAGNVSTATIYTYTNHRLTSESTAGNVTEYRYDANGNTIAKLNDSVTYQYTYTPRNEVASVTTQSGTYTYTYNASSLRTSKTANGVTTSFIWAGDNIIREETPDKSTDYFYGVNRVSRTVKGDTYTYNAVTDSYYDETTEEYIETVVPVNGYHEFYAYDGRGNVVHTMAIDSVDLYLSPFYGSAAPFPEMDLNCDGEFDFMDLNTASVKYPIVQNYYYSPFGEMWQGERSTDTNPFRYAGEYLDNETGDIYLRARYYDPSIGRFISVDPIKDGTNWYVYCSNNPIAFVDPSGLLPTDEEAAKMSEFVYSEDINWENTQEGIASRTVSGWLLSAPIAGRESLVGGVFTKTHEDGSVEYTIAFRGSILLFDTDHIEETLSVWINNFEQAFSSKSTDAWDAIVFGVDFVEDHPNSEITFVGHSKGGAEAILAAVATNKNAITFNSAKPNLENYGLSISNYTGCITSHVVRGELLSLIKQSNDVGNINYIDVEIPITTSTNIIENYINKLKIAFEKHKIIHLVNHFKEKKQ